MTFVKRSIIVQVRPLLIGLPIVLAAISPGREQNRDTARCQPTRFLKSVKS